ncbi:MAG: hypothetical protein P8Y14_20020 [Anaerolineales bacterium]|jgi:hypothetical protein
MALSGQKTVMTAGTAEALGSQRICAPYMLKALITNTALANIVNDGAADVSSNFPTFKRANVPTCQRSNLQTCKLPNLPTLNQRNHSSQ